MRVTIQVRHNCTVAFARWCTSVGWNPSNLIPEAKCVDGVWLNEKGEDVTGLICFNVPKQIKFGEVLAVDIDNLRVAACGDGDACRVIGRVDY